MHQLTRSGNGCFAARNATTNRPLAVGVRTAATRVARAIGLLLHTELPAGEGLWIVPSRGVHTWGMRFPIDVIALDGQGRVVDAVQNLRPWSMRLPRPGCIGVLELPAGSIAQSGTQLGDCIVFETDAPRRNEGKGGPPDVTDDWAA